ncbi:MAG TPA: hypothetical protein VGY48_25010 [Vicinamibacterales bacterium]|nr:hypothetical protein [Vicinamibacterales bacterium]
MSDNRLPLPVASFTTVDVGGRMPIRSGISVQAGVKNLLDANYYYWKGFPEAGRAAYVTIRYAFSRAACQSTRYRRTAHSVARLEIASCVGDDLPPGRMICCLDADDPRLKRTVMLLHELEEFMLR